MAESARLASAGTLRERFSGTSRHGYIAPYTASFLSD
jgi:hypothetical protein